MAEVENHQIWCWARLYAPPIGVCQEKGFSSASSNPCNGLRKSIIPSDVPENHCQVRFSNSLHLLGFATTAFLSLREVRWISSIAARTSWKSPAKVISVPLEHSTQPDLVRAKPAFQIKDELKCLVEIRLNLSHKIPAYHRTPQGRQWGMSQPSWTKCSSRKPAFHLFFARLQGKLTTPTKSAK